MSTEPLQDHTGTVVLWEDLDRILEYKDPWGEWARGKSSSAWPRRSTSTSGWSSTASLRARCEDRPKLTITINGRVEGASRGTRSAGASRRPKSFRAKDLRVAGDGGVGFVRVSSYVLPAQRDFSSDAAWRRASGPLQWNRQQGLYIYRANRMIQSGGWNRIRAQDEHTKLARMSLDFFPNLDAVFGINIAKAYVNLPRTCGSSSSRSSPSAPGWRTRSTGTNGRRAARAVPRAPSRRSRSDRSARTKWRCGVRHRDRSTPTATAAGNRPPTDARRGRRSRRSPSTSERPPL